MRHIKFFENHKNNIQILINKFESLSNDSVEYFNRENVDLDVRFFKTLPFNLSDVDLHYMILRKILQKNNLDLESYDEDSIAIKKVPLWKKSKILDTLNDQTGILESFECFNELVDTIFKDIMSSDSQTEHMLIDYRYENEINDDIDDNKISETEDYKKWLRYEIEYRLDNLKNNIKKLNENGKIRIYRVIRVNDKWYDFIKKNKTITLGIYWSYDEKAAEAHWGYNNSKNIEVRLTAIVKFDEIDWNTTFLQNMNLEIGEMEKEITLFENTVLMLEKITLRNISYEKNSDEVEVRVPSNVYKS